MPGPPGPPLGRGASAARRVLTSRLIAALPGRTSLGGRALRAGGWSLGQMMTSHLFRLGSNLIMTRLLVPEAFGLMAMAVTVITAFTLFTDIGINRSIVREPEGDTDQFLRVAWIVKAGRGAAIAGGVLATAILLWLLAPAFAAEGTVYADPRLPGLIALAALVPLLMGAEATTRELAQRRLELGRITGVEIGSQLISMAAMIGFALVWPSVWALMIGMLTGSVAKTAASHVVFRGPRMALVWDAAIADRLWQYGKWLMGSSVFTFVANNADRFILGALLDATTFGVYVIAQLWIVAGASVISRMGGQIGFSAIGEVLRDRPTEAPRLFRKFQRVIDAFCIAAFLAMFLLGGTLIDLLYTDAYARAGDYVAILSLSFLAVRFYTMNELVMNLGNTRAIMRISCLHAVTICVTLPLAYRAFGIEGALLAVALNPLVSVPYTLHLVRPVLKSVRWDAMWPVATLVLAVLIVTLS